MGRVSGAPSKATSGGGLFGADGQAGTVKRARWAVFDYKGKADKAVTLQLLIEDESGTEHEQHIRAFANPERYKIVDNGRQLETEGEDTAPNDRSQYMLFANSLTTLDASWDAKLDSGPASLDGAKFVFQRVKQKHDAFVGRDGKQVAEGTNEILIVTKILAAGAGTSASTSGNGADASDDAKMYAQTFLSEAVAAAGDKGILVKGIVIAVNPRIQKDADAKKIGKEILQISQKPGFLSEGAELGLWGYDPKAAKLTAA